jgi:hypothetical protein
MLLDHQPLLYDSCSSGHSCAQLKTFVRHFHRTLAVRTSTAGQLARHSRRTLRAPAASAASKSDLRLSGTHESVATGYEACVMSRRRWHLPVQDRVNNARNGAVIARCSWDRTFCHNRWRRCSRCVLTFLWRVACLKRVAWPVHCSALLSSNLQIKHCLILYYKILM